jgi:Secretion system C-terminal sorting domain
MRPLLLIFALLFCLKTTAQSYDYRHPWYAPFSQNSIWNTPIGSGATLVAANLPASYYLCTDDEWFIQVKTATSTDQVVNTPSSWGTRWPGNSAWWQGTLRVPNDLIIPDANPPSTPNACATFLLPDNQTIVQLEPACRKFANQPIVGYRFGTDYNLFSAGSGGSHFGSSLSAIGGSIRLGELTGSDPLRHALKLNIWGNHLFYSTTNPGFRWPATTTDACASTCYLGTNSKLVMGTLLAIPQSATAASLGITTSVGQKLLAALKNYGAYITDDSGWNDYDFCVERGVVDEVQTKTGLVMCGTSGAYFADIQRLIAAMKIVDNNTATSIGGGGTPVTSLALPFCTAATGITVVQENISNSNNKRYKVANFQASNYTWNVSNGTVVGSATGNTIEVNWGSSASGSVAATVANEYINFSNTYSYTAAVLPVELLNFVGTTEKEGNRLTWHFGDIKDVKDIEIQKSADGQNFDPLSILSKNTLFFIDKMPFNLTYYRLKINDLGGKTHFSKIISLTKNDRVGVKMRIYPNPVSSVLTIENINEQGFIIVNTLGQIVKTSRLVTSPTLIDVSSLPNGVYLIKTASETVRFAKN